MKGSTMELQTNRRRCLMLLAAPFLASSVALAPAVAAQERAAEPGAVPMVSSCKLAPDGSAKPGSGTGYVLRLGGFPAKQSVQVDGPKTSFRAMVNAKGELDRKGLRHGTYSVSYKVGQQSKRVTCATPPPQTPAGKQTVKITKLEVVVLTPAGTVIDCTKPTTAEFDGKITATGQGKVRYYWTYASSATPTSPGTLDFNPRTTNHTLLHVVEVPGQANASKITTFVTLHLPDQKMSAQSAQVTFTCE